MSIQFHAIELIRNEMVDLQLYSVDRENGSGMVTDSKGGNWVRLNDVDKLVRRVEQQLINELGVNTHGARANPEAPVHVTGDL